jgi:hypothetical protein
MFKPLRVAVLLLALPASVHAQCDYGIEVTKYADRSAAVIGMDVVYTIEVTNVSECSVHLDHVQDSLLGDLTGAFMPVLDPGTSDAHSYAHSVSSGDPDPLVNSVTAVYSDDAGDTYEGSAEAVVNILHPNVQTTLWCDDQPPAEPGTAAGFVLWVTNSGDVELVFTFEGFPFSVDPMVAPPGVPLAFFYDVPCEGGIACSEVSFVATLPPEFGLEFSLEGSIDECCKCDVSPTERSSWGVIKALYGR